MRIGVLAEIRAGETRVAATPETVKKLAAKNEVRVQAGAGAGASIPDRDYQAAGAKLVGSAAEAYDADIVLKVRAPSEPELYFLKSNSVLIGLLEPFNAAGLEALARRGVTGFAMESLPRISRAQSMDVLSSQANIAGYKAVLLAAAEIGRFFPMLMTAAGTVKAARVVILGVGVAGLQAIA
ncbi:MAG: NAD(P)(+) transhydrogenase (Re/Si-specific) subunit alpha, partial [Pseudomonadota bacterium]|nr:NAD(P)(+) transhydrogenase (Re/Si-specific) subunit alpha [Pseudomonadota bacterium]